MNIPASSIRPFGYTGIPDCGPVMQQLNWIRGDVTADNLADKVLSVLKGLYWQEMSMQEITHLMKMYAEIYGATKVEVCAMNDYFTISYLYKGEGSGHTFQRRSNANS